MVQRLAQAWRKWPTGIYAAWYPVKEPDAVTRFHAAVVASGVQRVLDLRVLRRPPTVPATLVGTGMVVVNPPWRLADEMAVLLPALADRLGSGSGASWSCNWLVPEQG
jgi:23S rRNA (adenine2030-N6)-methyltransferase